MPLPIFFYTDIPTCNRRDDDAFLPILFSYLLPFGFDIRGKAVVFIKYIVMIMVKDGILTIFLRCTVFLHKFRMLFKPMRRVLDSTFCRQA